MAKSPIAVVAGDVSNSPYTTIEELRRIAMHYDKVIFVDGNHEHYSNRSDSPNRSNRMPPETYSMFRKAFERDPKIFYLDQGRNTCVVDKTAFIGANGWYDFNWSYVNPDHCKSAWYQHMNDSFWANIEAEWTELECMKHSANMAATVAAMNQQHGVERIVLVTHTIPSERGVWTNPSDYTWNLLNGCYYNSCAKQAHNGKVVAHCFGHTHRSQFFHEGGIDFHCNPRGYQGEPSFHKWAPEQIDLDAKGSAFGDIE